MDCTTRHLRILGLCLLAAAFGGCASPSGASQCEATGILCPPQSHCAAAEPVCIADTNLCGNAHMDPGEVCDDGNTKDGDECSHDCKSTLKCGNGIKDDNAAVPEVCDDGNTKDGDGCSHDCLSKETCGNSIVDVGEICDDGNDLAGDGCSHSCQSNETCGNGITDPGEACDMPGDLVHCSADCTSTLNCSNGKVDPGEECDLRITDSGGNVIASNADTADCRVDCVENRCGDGYVNMTGSGPGHTEHVEECDDAPPARTIPDGPNHNARTVIPTETAHCNIDCTLAKCGDGKINRHFIPKDGNNVPAPDFEECDDGVSNSNSGDCTATCQTNVCGDGHTNTTPGPTHEDCDNGAANGTVGNNCTATCHINMCNNGVLDPGEQCDDGAAGNGTNKRCSSTCKFNTCGDADAFTGVEQCDGGNGTPGSPNPRDTAGCDLDCTLPVCGDGHKNTQAGEACDDGAANGTMLSTCSLNCKIATCGNGVTEQGEECDDGDGTPKDSATCNSDCKITKCGDHHKNTLAGEQCDDGVDNGVSPSTCSTTCKTVTCSNGVIEQGEDCDDGKDAMGNNNNHAGARCNGTCQFNVCGDSDKLVGSEECDSGGVNTAACNANCTLSLCGDGIKNTADGEQCDDGDKNGTAASPNNCNAFCKTNACGNGIEDLNEECDPGGGGSPADTAVCNFDCKLSRCGDGHKNLQTPEACDDGPLNGDPCAYNDPNCTRCNSTCTGLVSPGGKFCGDGLKQTTLGEQCDPGGGFPAPDALACDSDCTPVACGDLHINGVAGEVCDDGNNDACGTCNATCHASVTPTNATGSIKTAAAVTGQGNIKDGDLITLDDGFHTPVIFEFDVGNTGITTGHVPISLLGDGSELAPKVAMKVQAAIAAQSTLDIGAVAGGTNGDVVTLTNTHASSKGTKAIGHSGNIDASFVFTDLAGGLAGDCSQGTGCKLNADCTSNSCNQTTHVCN